MTAMPKAKKIPKIKKCRTCHFRPCRCEDLRVGFALGLDFHKAQWPLNSDAAGVHPKQIALATEEARRLGTHIAYTKDGSAIFDSHQHRKEYMQKFGMVDMSRETTMPKYKTMLERSPNDPY